jgi:FixJ family two-component response regulator
MPEQPRILLVEDDPAVRRSLQILLQARGYDVRAHATGATLLADPMADASVALVADYRLTGLDGIEVLQALRAQGWAAPAILITAFGSADLTARATTAGYAAVIEKPLRDQLLVTTLAQLTLTETRIL